MSRRTNLHARLQMLRIILLLCYLSRAHCIRPSTQCQPLLHVWGCYRLPQQHFRGNVNCKQHRFSFAAG